MTAPAMQLLGRTLADGWLVVEEFQLAASGTGGTFSAGYIAERDGHRVFVKALDLSRAGSPGVNRIDELKRLTTKFAFERDLLDACATKKMDKVVRAVGRGEVMVAPGLGGTVDYLLFELADGDIRKHMEQAASLNAAWVFRCLQHISNGIGQLHQANIAHQDVKPSNVLVYSKLTSKIGDLGRAVLKGVDGPHDGRRIPGAQSYAPPELLYSEIPTEWAARRFGCDLYLLGSMVVFLFAKTTMTALLFAELPAQFHYQSYRGFFRDVLPHLRDAMDQGMARFSLSVPAPYTDQVLRIVRELCDPDPLRRGHPRNVIMKNGSQYSVERYVSEFNLLASRAASAARR